jgi:hypothetical protein
MLAAIEEIQNLKTVAGEVVKIRLENLSWYQNALPINSGQ